MDALTVPVRGREAFPVGVARLADVHMRVDQPRQEDLAVRQLDHVLCCRRMLQRADGGDAAGPDADGRRHLRTATDSTRRPDDKVEADGHAGLAMDTLSGIMNNKYKIY